MSARGVHGVAGALRVGALLALVGAGAVATLCVRARARSDELLQDAGAALLSYARAGRLDAPRTLWLNGASLRVLSGSTPDSLDTLLDVLQARCRKLGLRFDPATVPRAPLPHGLRAALPALDGVLRGQHGGAGYVACLDLGGVTLAPRDLIGRLRALRASGDLRALGQLRFAWARREGAATAYVAVWSEGSLPLRAMFPARGDAPGRDLPGVPRPAGARRVLSAWQQERAPMLVGYRAALPAAQLMARYRVALEAQGFHVRALEPAAAHTLLLSRGSALASATISADGRNAARLTLLPLR